jgi:hypothetical protein
MFVMCSYCDLGKKNATAGLYFQPIFLKHQLMQSNVVQGNLTFYLHFQGLGEGLFAFVNSSYLSCTVNHFLGIFQINSVSYI